MDPRSRKMDPRCLPRLLPNVRELFTSALRQDNPISNKFAFYEER